MADIKIAATSTYVKLTGSFGYNTHTLNGSLANTTIDATGASWIVSNSANQYPDADTSYLSGTGTINKIALFIYSAGLNLTVKGGTIWGEVPQTSDWVYTYNHSAAIRIANAPGITIDSWRVDKVWDAVSIYDKSWGGQTFPGTTNFLITDVHFSNVRDDAVEDDQALSGTIRDSLFDGVFSGVSLYDGSNFDGSNNTITLEHVFLRHETYLYNGEMTHMSPFKTNVGVPGTTPDIRIINSVFAIEDPTHGGLKNLQLAWANVVESRGNVFLNLSDTPLPSWYPLPPAGFTVLQGQAARDYWEKAKAAWLDNHDGTPFADLTPLPAIGGTQPVPEPTPDPVPTNVINGTLSRDKLLGTAGADQIDGRAGNDLLYGRGGADRLTGGSGSDKFVFDSKLDGTVDIITDFDPRYDSIYLDNAIFTKLGSGSLLAPVELNSGWLVDGPGARPADANDYIVYDKTTGALFYDADGSGSGAAVKIALLSAGLDLSSNDFFVM